MKHPLRIIPALCALLLTYGIAAAQKTSTTQKQGSAWTLEFPLGDPKASTIDTLLYNYQRQAIPSMASNAYVCTGNLGAEGMTLLYMQRPALKGFFFESSLLNYVPQQGKEKFYNVYVPMTLMSYNFGGGRDTQQDRFRTSFAGNVNRRIGISADVDYIYSKGSYEAQAAKDYSFGIRGYYRGDRYRAQAFFYFYDFLNKENGGITNELYITDPAQLQGGVSSIAAKSIPTNLDAAHSRLKGAQFFMNHSYALGYWKDEEVNDTLTRQVYVPVTRFIYSFSYVTGHHLFNQTSASQEQSFWENHYFSTSGSHDNTKVRFITNTVGVEMVEGFRPWAKFGLSALFTWSNSRFRQANMFYAQDWPDFGAGEELTPLPEGFKCPEQFISNRLWIGAGLNKTSGKILKYAAKVRFGLYGAAKGDVEIDANVTTRVPLFGDTVSVQAKGSFYNVHQPYMHKHYISNNFLWNESFGKTRKTRIEGTLKIPWTRTSLTAGVENIQNLVYFGPQCTPVQEGGNIQVFAATLQQDLKFGIWNWRNTITYQASSNHDVLPMPALAIYSNMYLQFKPLKRLELQIGIDCDFYTKYRSYLYQPATMSFYVQSPDDYKTVGAYPFCNLYVTAKLYKTRFFLMMSHINQGWFGSNYFVMPNYPLNPRRFQLGLSVDFAN